MFVVTWGQRQVSGTLASLGICQFCQTDAACSVTIRYTYAEMLWVCGVCLSKVFSVCCKHCGKYRQLSWTERSRASNKLIPFRERFGLLIFVGFVVAFGALYKGP